MSVQPRIDDGELVIVLTGVDRVLCWRRDVRVDVDAVTSGRREHRDVLESRLDSHLYGRGTNRGERGRGRARVGAYLGPRCPGSEAVLGGHRC